MKKANYILICMGILIAGFRIYDWYENKPLYCGGWIELSEKQIKRAIDFDIGLTSKDFEQIFGNSSNGHYFLYGDYPNTCKIPKQFDGYKALFRTFHEGELNIIWISAFKIDRYKSDYQELLAGGVEQDQDLIITETTIFWRTDDVYYSIEAKPELIQVMMDANTDGNLQDSFKEQ